MRILIVKLGALGDVINTFPVVVNIKTRLNAEIHWLVAPLSAPLVSAHRFVDKTILFDKNRITATLPAVMKRLRSYRYDMVLDLQRLFKSGLFTMAANASRRIGFDRDRCKELSWLFPFERIPPSSPDMHMVDQYMAFGKYLNIPCDRVTWAIPRSSAPFVNPDRPYAVLNIGATKPANRWPPHYFAGLAGRLRETLNLSCVITGGAEDRAAGRIIKHSTACRVADLTGKTNIPQLVEIIANAALVVTCDTGPMHLASALGTPLVALFGPSDPNRTGPYRGAVIRKHLPCSPCNRKICRHPLCMEQITPDDVLRKAASLTG